MNTTETTGTVETYVPRGNIYGPIIPQFILEKRITFGAKVMYALLCNYAATRDHCWPSQATLAEKLSCSVSSVKNYLGELVRAKLIDVRQGKYRSSVYYMMRPATLEKREEQQPKVATTQPDSACQQPKIGCINTLSKENKKILPPSNTVSVVPARPTSTPASAPAAGCVSVSVQDFERAWELYPKKEAKGLARASWLTLQRSRQLPAMATLLASIRQFMATESWQREQGRFVPQMSNWLRGQRWLDAMPATSQAKQTQPPLPATHTAHLEKEAAVKRERHEERERLRPYFEAFAQHFRERGLIGNEPMAFGLWLFLHSRQSAPTASCVPADTTQEIMVFLNAYKRKKDEAAYRLSSLLSQSMDAKLSAPFEARSAHIPRDSTLQKLSFIPALAPERTALRKAV